MCQEKRNPMIMYSIIKDRLRQDKDPYGMINHKEIQLTLCRLFHTPKQYTNGIIRELLGLRIIESMGRNSLGPFYKVR